MTPKAKSKTKAAVAPERTYHHGDLRRALVAAAIELLRAEGAEALTLRAVARAAGVSQAAPYRHFADRRALVAAVAEEGFRGLGDEMSRAMAEAMRSGNMRLAFREVGLAYVRFALQHPAEYRVMFGAEVANHQDLPGLRARSHAVLDGVAQAVAGLQQARLVGAGDPGTMAAALWATLHGLVMLSLDGQTTGVVASLDALVDEALRLVMFGMAPR
jgi:AcrR family transcriptional regulator